MRKSISFPMVIAAMLACSQAAFAGDHFPRVVVTVAPLKPYADAILHESGAAQSLLRPGQDPHDFALSPAQAQMLDQADILIVPDLSMNPVFAQIVTKKKKLRVIELSKLPGADPLPYPAQNPWVDAVKTAGHEKDEEGATVVDATKDKPAGDTKEKAKPIIIGAHPLPDRTATDPHFWLDPERMAALAVPLASAIADRSADYRVVLEANAATLATHLRRDVMPPLQAILANRPTHSPVANKTEVPFITYHAGYQYFLARFNIADQGELTVRPEDYMGAKTLDTMLIAAKQTHIRCIFAENETSLIKRIAALTQAKIILISPDQLIERRASDSVSWIESDYDRLLYETAKQFRGCL